MRRWLLLTLLMCPSFATIGQEGAISTLYDRNLVITDNGLLDTKKRIMVLDLDALAASINRASDYFDVKRRREGKNICGSFPTAFGPHYELSKAGRVYACVQLSSLPALRPSEPRALPDPVTLDRILFVGPICDRVGACPGMLLTEIPQFAPMRDCSMAEGSVVCNPKYADRGAHIYYDIQSCNKEFSGVVLDEQTIFKKKRGRFSLCAIDLYKLQAN